MELRINKIQLDKIPFLPVFGVSFLGGVFIVCLGKSEFLNSSSILSEDALYQVKDMLLDRKALFLSVSIKRIFRLLTFMVLATTQVYSINIWIHLIGYGLLSGMLFGILVLRYAIKGLLLMIIGLFPHYLVYVLVMVWAIGLCRHKKYWSTQYCFQILFLAGIMLIGVFLESYVNPYLLKKYLSVFII